MYIRATAYVLKLNAVQRNQDKFQNSVYKNYFIFRCVSV